MYRPSETISARDLHSLIDLNVELSCVTSNSETAMLEDVSQCYSSVALDKAFCTFHGHQRQIIEVYSTGRISSIVPMKGTVICETALCPAALRRGTCW